MNPAPSLLGFGCASVMGRISKRTSLNAMSVAFDLGVSHFDVARSYGFGDAEAVLGEFLRGRRHSVTVTTKFGIVPPELSGGQRLARAAGRPFYRAVAKVAGALRRRSGQLLGDRNFDLSYAQQCLHTSLTHLRTDYLDFYLLHEPDIGSLSNFDELNNFCSLQRDAGKIRAWGIAHPRGDLRELRPFGSVLQLPSLDRRTSTEEEELKRAFEFNFVTQPFAGKLPPLNQLEHLTKDSRALTKHELSLYWAASQVRGKGSVVTGMYMPAHIRENARIIAQISGMSSES